MTLQETSCCGVDELYGLEDPITTLSEFACEIDDFNGAFVWFADAVKYGRGEELAQYIKKMKLGTVWETHARNNPNSGNSIRVWVWSVNRKAVAKWDRKNGNHEDHDCQKSYADDESWF